MAAEMAEGVDMIAVDPIAAVGGSVSIGILPPILAYRTPPSEPQLTPQDAGFTEEDDPTAAVVAARAEVAAAGEELQLRSRHLINLKEELAGMKRLLDVTQQRVQASTGGAGNQVSTGVGTVSSIT